MSEQARSEARFSSRLGSGVVVPPPYSHRGSEAADPPVELRGSLDCWACSVLVTAQNMIIALINFSLASILFGIILTPALTMIVFGFLCHSTVNTYIYLYNYLGFNERKCCFKRLKERGLSNQPLELHLLMSIFNQTLMLECQRKERNSFISGDLTLFSQLFLEPPRAHLLSCSRSL